MAWVDTAGSQAQHRRAREGLIALGAQQLTSVMAHMHEVSLSLPASLQAQGAPASLSVPLQLFIDNKFHDGATVRAFPWLPSPDIAQRERPLA